MALADVSSGTGTTAISLMGAPGSASIDMTNHGTIHVDAVADAAADWNAYAFATALYGMAAVASVAGDADISLTNAGDLRVSANAHAVGGHAATAGAQIKNKTVREVLAELVASIDQFYES